MSASEKSLKKLWGECKSDVITERVIHIETAIESYSREKIILEKRCYIGLSEIFKKHL